MLLDDFIKERGDLLEEKEIVDLFGIGKKLIEDDLDDVEEVVSEKAYKAIKEAIENGGVGDGDNDSSGPYYKEITQVRESITDIDEFDKMDVFNLAKEGIENVTNENVDEVMDITGKELSLDEFDEELVGLGKSGYKHKRGKYLYHGIKIGECTEEGILYKGVSYAKVGKRKVYTDFVVKGIEVGGNTYMDVRFPNRSKTYRENDRDYLVSEIYELIQRLEGQKTLNAQSEMFAEDDDSEGGDE